MAIRPVLAVDHRETEDNAGERTDRQRIAGAQAAVVRERLVGAFV